MESHPLCYRCEHRAAYHEKGHAPRYECGTDGAVVGCYMYRPVKPVTTRPRTGDNRPQYAGGMFSGRLDGVRVADGKYVMVEKDGEHTVYFTGKDNDE